MIAGIFINIFNIVNIYACMYGSTLHDKGSTDRWHSFLDYRSRVWTGGTSLFQATKDTSQLINISKFIYFIQSSGAYGSTRPLHAEDPS